MVGLTIEPCGTPDFMYVNAESPFPWTIAYCLSLKYDVNQAIDLQLKSIYLDAADGEIQKQPSIMGRSC